VQLPLVGAQFPAIARAVAKAARSGFRSDGRRPPGRSGTAARAAWQAIPHHVAAPT
jgi:hypothetical protein